MKLHMVNVRGNKGVKKGVEGRDTPGSFTTLNFESYITLHLKASRQ